jgi:hypothetical protein
MQGFSTTWIQPHLLRGLIFDILWFMLESTQAEEEDVRPLHETHDIHVRIAIAVQNGFLHYISCLVVP